MSQTRLIDIPLTVRHDQSTVRDDQSTVRHDPWTAVGAAEATRRPWCNILVGLLFVASFVCMVVGIALHNGAVVIGGMVVALMSFSFSAGALWKLHCHQVPELCHYALAITWMLAGLVCNIVGLVIADTATAIAGIVVCLLGAMFYAGMTSEM